MSATMNTADDVPSKLEVSQLLKSKFMGKSYVYLESVDSTSSYLASMDNDKAVHGAVVAADRQTAGRGRMQNTWYSPPGTNLYFSVLLQPEIVPQKAPLLALVTAAALMKVFKQKYPGLHPEVKWPNDILVQGRKLAGILCEMQTEEDKVSRVIIGIGINVNGKSESYPFELRERAISLRDATGATSSRQVLIASILTEFEKCYELWLQQGLSPFKKILENNSATRDSEIIAVMNNREVRGIARGISDEGYLMIETSDGLVQLPAGEVHIKKKI
ncbi:MAG: biotin--[acetyl-CoA-carboxylase] ligase [Nitrospiraceae bacterium]|nr:MAG: biotin--[acetyl-CoA-carboxylase] ligase [Nitrospiraceae bacterium]